MIKYDVYRRPITGLLYRVRLDAPLWDSAEFRYPGEGYWTLSSYTIGGLLYQDNNELVARNVVFKACLC